MINREYYGSAEGEVWEELKSESKPERTGITLSEEVLRRVLRRIYERKGYSEGDIDGELYSHILESFNNAVDEGRQMASDEGVEMEDTAFIEELKTNNEVFSAFRTHRMERDIASQLTDEEGRLKSFSRFSRDVQPITDHHVKAWLRTEYNTAVFRAHQAVAWKEYERRADVLPNLRWMPSTSVEPGADHKIYWGTVLPVDHPFWSAHRPGDRWNCKCSLEATDDDTTAEPITPPGDKRNRPARGLENNPGKDGRLFSDKHPYFAEKCATCPFGKGKSKGGLMALVGGKKGDCYECRRVAKSIARVRRIAIYKNDKQYPDRLKIHRMADKRELKDNIRAARAIVGSLPDVVVSIRAHSKEKGVKNPEYEINGLIADRKGIESEKGITSGFRKAIEQGCKAVVIDLDMNPEKFSILRTEKITKHVYFRIGDFISGKILECYVIYKGKAVRINEKHFSDNKKETVVNIENELKKIEND